jgi:hypothetical protein
MADKNKQPQRPAGTDETMDRKKRDMNKESVTDQQVPGSDAEDIKGGLMPIRRGQDA